VLRSNDYKNGPIVHWLRAHYYRTEQSEQQHKLHIAHHPTHQRTTRSHRRSTTHGTARTAQRAAHTTAGARRAVREHYHSAEHIVRNHA
jgi:hypothetical protein